MTSAAPRPTPAPTAPAAPSRALHVAALLTLIAAALFCYRNSFSVPFVYDDVPAIAGNPSLASFSSALSPPPHLTTSGRPLVNLSLALNHALGGTDVLGYHVVNLAIHVLAALTLFGLLRRSLACPPLAARFGAAALPLAFTISALWLLHPLQTESVTYIVQRAESLVGLFLLLTLYAFARGTTATTPSRAILWLIVCVLSCYLGMATKEVMVSAPLLVLLYDRTFIAGTFRAAWQTRRPFYLALASSWLLLAALLVTTGGTRDGSAGFGQGMTSWDYLITQAHALALYLKLSFWPAPLVFDYGRATVPFTSALPALLLILALLAATVVALRRRPAVGFAGAAFFAILAPSSSIVPVVTETIAEHRMYLPLAAVLAVAVLVVFNYLGRRSLTVLFAAALVLGFATTERNATYRDHVALWSDTVEKIPANPRAHSHLASALAAAGREPEALAHHATAARLAPRDAKLQFNLATALFRANRLDESAAQFELTLQLNPAHADAHNNYRNLLLRLGRRDAAAHHFRETLRLDPGFAPAHNNLGIVLGASGDLVAAIAHFEAALRDQPDYAEAHNNLGFALRTLGRNADAIAHFRTALRLAPNYAEAHNNLALTLVATGRPADSVPHFREVIRLAPDYTEARDRLQHTLAALGR